MTTANNFNDFIDLLTKVNDGTHTIERFSSDLMQWLPLEDFNIVIAPPHMPQYIHYRAVPIAKTEPEFNWNSIWDALPPNAKWIAMDHNLNWYAYQSRPTQGDESWVSTLYRVISLHRYKLPTVPQNKWHTTLIQRP